MGSSRWLAVTGVRSTIDIYSPWVYNPYPSGGYSQVSTWVQLADTDYDKWVKYGYVEFPGDVRRHYIEVKDVGVHQILSSPPTPWVGASREFRLDRQGTTISPKLDGIYQGPGAVSVALGVDLAQVMGETRTAADQMVGAVNDYVFFIGTQVRYGSTWIDFAGVPSNSMSPWYGLTGYSTTSFAIWDKSCQN